MFNYSLNKMTQIVSMEGKENSKSSRKSIFSSLYDWFSSLHKFDKLFILIAILVIVATPTIISNYQIFNPEAAKGGGRTSASLVVFQEGVQVSSVSAGSAIDVVGSGFARNQTVYVGLQGFIGMTALTADGSG